MTTLFPCMLPHSPCLLPTALLNEQAMLPTRVNGADPHMDSSARHIWISRTCRYCLGSHGRQGEATFAKAPSAQRSRMSPVWSLPHTHAVQCLHSSPSTQVPTAHVALPWHCHGSSSNSRSPRYDPFAAEYGAVTSPWHHPHILLFARTCGLPWARASGRTRRLDYTHQAPGV